MRKKRKETLASFTLISRLQQRSLIICIREVIMIFIFCLFWPRLVEDEEAGNSNRTRSPIALLFGQFVLCECIVWRLSTTCAPIVQGGRRPLCQWGTTDESVSFWWRQLSCSISLAVYFILHARWISMGSCCCLSGGALCVCDFSCRASFNTNSLCISININI